MTAALHPRDPYATLNIPRDATRETIRNAYRRRAKQTHPDAGGSREEFARIQHAYLLLTDDTRRAKFDATGDVDEAQPDNAHAQAIEAIAQLLDATLSNCERASRAPTELDLIDLMKQLAHDLLRDADREKQKLLKNKARIEKLTGRFKLKPARGERPAMNFFEGFLRAKLRPIEAQIATHERNERNFKQAIELLEDFTFAFDAPPGPTTESPVANLFFSGFPATTSTA